MKKKILLTACLVCILSAGIAQADLAQSIQAITGRSSQQKTKFAIQIIEADTGRAVYSYNAYSSMQPASNMKIITSAAALKYLGSDFEYKTKVGLSGNTLVVIGSGDPLLGSETADIKYGREAGWIFDDIAEKVRQSNIAEINDIIIDTTVFDDERVHPNWLKADLNKWFACEVCGLNYNENCIDMTVTNKSGRAVVSIEPETGYVKWQNKVDIISESTGAVWADRIIGQENNLEVKGTVRRAQGPFQVAIERPAGFFGHILAERLAKARIAARGHLRETAFTGNDFQELSEYTTPLADVFARCNKDSIGLMAEALLKTIAAHNNGGRGGSWAEGRRLASQYLKSLGINEDEFYIDDGSGLSTKNRLSADAITKVLYDVYKSENRQFFLDSLSIGGVDGTTGKFFDDEKYKGKIFGKTGYITGIRSFSGICRTDHGDYIFSILTEGGNLNTRPAINDITEAIFE